MATGVIRFFDYKQILYNTKLRFTAKIAIQFSWIKHKYLIAIAV